MAGGHSGDATQAHIYNALCGIKIFSQLNLIRFGLAIISVAVIILILPRADHQSFSFEENPNPGNIHCLRRTFDTLFCADSASARKMRDSINRLRPVRQTRL